MEPRAALAEYDAGSDQLTLWNTSQNPHVARLVISAFVGMAPEHKLRVIAPDVGGGFGSKIFIYPEEVVALWASRRVGRPVKWISDRSEAFLADAHGRDHVTHAEMAFDADGKILGLRAKTIANIGAYMSTFSSAIPTYLYATLLSGQYAIPQIYCEVDAVYTNTVPVDAYRGAGRPEASFVVERLIEVGARELGQDPADLRRKNFVKTFPHQTPVIMAYDAGDYDASLKKAMELADYKGIAKRKREAARRGKLRGIGFSAYIEACGIAPSQAVGSLGGGVGLWESAEVRVNPTGSVEILTGSHCPRPRPRDDVRPARIGPARHPDRQHLDRAWRHRQGAIRHGHLWLALGRRSACRRSSRRWIRSRPRPRRSRRIVLEAAEGDIEFKDGKFTVAGTDKSAPGATSRSTPTSRTNSPVRNLKPGLKESAFYDPTNFTFPAGCHICEVEVDPETGNTEIVAWTAVDDFGVADQPDDRRGAGPRRHRAGRRPGAVRGRGLRQGRPARHRLVHGLLPCRAPITCRR